MTHRFIHCISIAAIAWHLPLYSEAFNLGKACPTSYQNKPLGLFAFSTHWFHSARYNASYIASDNATGIGIEIHWFSNARGKIDDRNIAKCDQYRMIQSRHTSARVSTDEQALQIDVPSFLDTPFYDQLPMEFGRGTHYSPADTNDKPWQLAPTRASTLAIYDTPYISDYFGIEGHNIDVTFETCLVCARDNSYDSLLACGQWGYTREFIDSRSGWAEPEFNGVSCLTAPSMLEKALRNSTNIDYPYWLSWR